MRKTLFLVAITITICTNLDTLAKEANERNSTNEIPSNREIFGFVRDITSFGPRPSGSEANINAAAYIADKFSDFGLENISIETGNTLQWNASKWGLEIEGVSIPSFYMRYSFYEGKESIFSTGSGGLTAPVVYVGNRKDLSKLDVKGKIVVADVELSEANLDRIKAMSSYIYDPNRSFSSQTRLDPFTPNNYPFNIMSAIENGALGFVGVLTNYFDSNQYYNEDVAYFVDEEKHFTIPALWVSNKEGSQLKSILEKSPNARAKMVLEGSAKNVKYHTVVGHLLGKTDEILMVQSHHDSGFLGAVEDASGVAEVLALAKYYSKEDMSSRERSMMFVTMDTHFTGYESHVDLASNYIIKGQRDVVANVTVEHIAKEMVVENGEAVMTGNVDPRIIISSPALLELTQEQVLKNELDRSIIISTDVFAAYDDGIPTDAGVIQSITGMPVISFLSAPAYLYDMADTLDKVAVDELQPTAKMLVELLDKLDTLPREKLEHTE